MHQSCAWLLPLLKYKHGCALGFDFGVVFTWRKLGFQKGSSRTNGALLSSGRARACPACPSPSRLCLSHRPCSGMPQPTEAQSEATLRQRTYRGAPDMTQSQPQASRLSFARPSHHNSESRRECTRGGSQGHRVGSRSLACGELDAIVRADAPHGRW